MGQVKFITATKREKKRKGFPHHSQSLLFSEYVICFETEADACQQHCKISGTDVSENVYLCSKMNYHEKKICIGLFIYYTR